MNEDNKCQIITPFFNEENNFIDFTNRLEIMLQKIDDNDKEMKNVATEMTQH